MDRIQSSGWLEANLYACLVIVLLECNIFFYSYVFANVPFKLTCNEVEI